MQRRLRGHAGGALPGLPDGAGRAGGRRAGSRSRAEAVPRTRAARCRAPAAATSLPVPPAHRGLRTGSRLGLPSSAPPPRGSASSRPRAPRLSAPASPGTPLPPRRRAEGGGRAPGQGAWGAALSAAGEAVCPPPPPPRSGAGGAVGPPRAARRGCGAERGGRCDSSAIWRPPPPFGFSPLSDVAPARALRTRGAGGRTCAARGAKPLPGGARGRRP